MISPWILALGALGLCALSAGVGEAAQEAPLFEMRTYYAHPGKLDALQARFRDHTVKLFEKHGIKNVGYWVPVENAENKLIYVLEHRSKEARDASFKSFGADPAWQAARAKSEENGPLVQKIESQLMVATDYSPKLKFGGENRTYELRVYTASPGNLGHLNARFRDHTLKLFEKHGMTNIAYWNLTPGQPGAENMLIYILAHKSVDAAKASFDAFRQDPAWVTARTASEQKGGGSLTAQGGVKSTFMRPTDYSALK